MSLSPEPPLPTYAERAGVLRAMQQQKMTRSAHAYVRGSTAKFYEWLEASAGKVPQGPAPALEGSRARAHRRPASDHPARQTLLAADRAGAQGDRGAG